MHKTHGGGGLTCHDFGYGRAAGIPGPRPIQILGEVKKRTHSYTSHGENCTHSYVFFSNYTLSFTFGRKRYPIDILLK